MKRKNNMPGIVYIGLLGTSSRTMVYSFFWISILLGLFLIFKGFTNPVYFSGAFFFVSAYWYYYCIKWVDTHSSWE